MARKKYDLCRLGRIVKKYVAVRVRVFEAPNCSRKQIAHRLLFGLLGSLIGERAINHSEGPPHKPCANVICGEAGCFSYGNLYRFHRLEHSSIKFTSHEGKPYGSPDSRMQRLLRQMASRSIICELLFIFEARCAAAQHSPSILTVHPRLLNDQPLRFKPSPRLRKREFDFLFAGLRVAGLAVTDDGVPELTMEVAWVELGCGTPANTALN